ncbi:MAG: nucleotidyltransferase domain-containing protein [Bacteroidetes bacterium]|nr:MAG: nucleotidyltransferase domain-containing protein [Bacteroidota bacterium]
MKKGPRKYGILETDMINIISILSTNPKTKKVVLFGSRAIDNFGPGSDIDISWLGDDLGFDDVIEAGLAYDKLFLPYKLDLVIYHQIKEKALTEHIERVGIVLYEKQVVTKPNK